MAGNSDPVASEPRLFVGQVPTDKSAEDLLPLFADFGNIRNLHLVKGPDGKSRGCAMVLFERWSQAEAAMEAHDGKTVLPGGKGRALVVHFANPRRSSATGMPPEQGVAPKKLFIGQVPRDATEEQLRPLFEPYGDVVHLNILRTPRGASAGCAFVQYSKWAEAEQAIDAHNAKTVPPGGEVPLVVKFADARKKEPSQGRRGGQQDLWQDQRRQMGGAMPEQLLQMSQMGQMDPSSLTAALQAFSGASFGGPQFGGQAELMSSLALNPELAGSLPLGSSQQAGQAGTPYAGVLGLDMGAGGGSNPAGLQGGAPATMLEAFQRGMPGLGVQAGLLGSQREGGDLGLGGGEGGGGFYSRQPQPAQMFGASTPQFGMQIPQHVLAAQAQQQQQPQQAPQQQQQQTPSSSQQLALRHQRLGSGGASEVTNQWKLFVGQLPPEATEQELWSLFSPIGNILELYILRGPNGLSRGCGFVTYANRYLAQQAILQLNGKQVPPGKVLVVKLADRSLPSKPAAALPGSY